MKTGTGTASNSVFHQARIQPVAEPVPVFIDGDASPTRCLALRVAATAQSTKDVHQEPIRVRYSIHFNPALGWASAQRASIFVFAEWMHRFAIAAELCPLGGAVCLASGCKRA